MTQSLRERAAAVDEPPAADRDLSSPGPDPNWADTLPDIEYNDPITTAEAVPVHVAWNRVMADVRSVGKGDRFEGGSAGRFNYRGVDRVLNAVGPAFRRHGVAVIQVKTVPEYRDVTTSKGSKMRECTVTVDYLIYGPDGSTIPGQSIGEAVDTSDKGTTKACSVAYRNFLITALAIPLEDARLDAEAQHIERGERPAPKAQDYVGEILDPRTSLSRLSQIKQELLRHDLGLHMVQAEDRDQPIGPLLQRIGKDREEASKAARAAVEDSWPATAQPPAAAEGDA